MPSPPLTARKRKRTTYTVSYSEVQERDKDGRLREVIVIDDTPPPSALSASTATAQGPLGTGSPATATTHGSFQNSLYSAPIRTRARAALEAAEAEAQPPIKRRKREDDSKPAVVKKTQPQPQPNGKDYASGSGSGVVDEVKPNTSCDDKEGHYIIVPDDIIYHRYRTVRLLGQGTFGKVIEAHDTHTNTRVAIKIIRAIPKYRDASKIEIRVLQKLKERDPVNVNKCIHLLHWFDHRNHICLVSELLGMCVYDFLKENEFAPFPRQHIQSFARQLLGSVAFLHELHLIHTDLKPENILLVNNDFDVVAVPVYGKRNSPPRTKRIIRSTDIRLIDFGSATFEEEYHSTVVSTRHYRAPEIILGLGWSYPCDAYSLGCILVEFYTGSALYQTHDNLEHLAMMEMVMGRMPERFARAGARVKPEYFKEGGWREGREGAGSVGKDVGRLDWPKAKASRQSKKDVKGTRALQDVIPPLDIINRQFLDLVRRLLAFDPAQRISVKEALQHQYFTLAIPDEI